MYSFHSAFWMQMQLSPKAWGTLLRPSRCQKTSQGFEFLRAKIKFPLGKFNRFHHKFVLLHSFVISASLLSLYLQVWHSKEKINAPDGFESTPTSILDPHILNIVGRVCLGPCKHASVVGENMFACVSCSFFDHDSHWLHCFGETQTSPFSLDGFVRACT